MFLGGNEGPATQTREITAAVATNLNETVQLGKVLKDGGGSAKILFRARYTKMY